MFENASFGTVNSPQDLVAFLFAEKFAQLNVQKRRENRKLKSEVVVF